MVYGHYSRFTEIGVRQFVRKPGSAKETSWVQDDLAIVKLHVFQVGEVGLGRESWAFGMLRLYVTMIAVLQFVGEVVPPGCGGRGAETTPTKLLQALTVKVQGVKRSREDLSNTA